MLSRQILSILLVFFYFASSTNSSNIRTRTFEKTVDGNIFWELVHDNSRWDYARDSTWSYALCLKDSQNNSTIPCSIILEDNKIDGRVYREVCQLGLKNPKENNELLNNLQVHRFGKKKSLVLWHDKTNTIHVYTVHFPNCKIDEAMVAVVNQQLFNNIDSIQRDKVKVLAYDDNKYDVFYEDKVSEKYVWNKITFDESGKVIGGWMEILKFDYGERYVPSYAQFFQLPNGFNKIGHILIAANGQNATFFWQTDKRDETNVLASSSFNQNAMHMVGLSTANGILGVCNYYSINAIISCYQYNNQGVTTFHTDFKIGHDISEFGFVYYEIHNLPGGGFLFFVKPCPAEPECYFTDPHLYVTKVDANGIRYKTLEIMDYYSKKDSAICRRRLREGLYENGPNEYCRHLMEDESNPDQPLEYLYKFTHACFTDEQLSEQYV